MTIGRPRPAVNALPAYRPGKGAKQAEQEHGITDAIKLASNENALPPLPSIQRAVVDAIAGANRYADHRATAVRERLAEWLSVPVDSVTVSSGSVTLLQQLVLTYVDPGDEVAYPWRSFEVYPVYTQLAGGVAVTAPLDDELRPDLETLAEAITPATKLVFIATPNNPTGTAVTCGQLRELLDAVPEEAIVVIDEAYREFLHPSFGDPVRDVLPHHPNAFVTRTFSKAHGLAGIRFGYGVGHPDVVASVDKTLVPFAVTAAAQAAALAAIDAEDEIMERVADILAERDRVAAALLDAGWKIPDRQANFVYLPLGARTDEVTLALERRGVVVRPFSGEGIRVTVGTAEENTRFLDTLRQVAAP